MNDDPAGRPERPGDDPDAALGRRAERSTPGAGEASGDRAARERGHDADRDAGRTGDDGGATPVTQWIGRVVVVLLLVLFGVFAAANAHRVTFSWVFGSAEVAEGPTGETSGGVPLIVLLLLAFVVGAVVGALTALQRARTRRRAERSGSGGRGPGG